MTGFDLSQAYSGWPAHIRREMKAVKSASAVRSTSKLRSTGVAFFALFFLVLQPVCAAYERHIGASYAASAATVHDAARADDAPRGSLDRFTCCSEMQAGAIASESSVATGKNLTAAQMAVALPLAPFARPGLTLRPHPARSTLPPHSLSYHARSARILR